MDRLQELISALSDREVQAKDQLARINHACKICGSPADQFVNARSEFEYLNSHLCQDCQNYYLA